MKIEVTVNGVITENYKENIGMEEYIDSLDELKEGCRIIRLTHVKKEEHIIYKSKRQMDKELGYLGDHWYMDIRGKESDRDIVNLNDAFMDGLANGNIDSTF